jgi:hypothetical protein
MDNLFGQRESIELTNPILGENEEESSDDLEDGLLEHNYGNSTRWRENDEDQELHNLNENTEAVVRQKNDLGTFMVCSRAFSSSHSWLGSLFACCDVHFGIDYFCPNSLDCRSCM